MVQFECPNCGRNKELVDRTFTYRCECGYKWQVRVVVRHSRCVPPKNEAQMTLHDAPHLNIGGEDGGD